MCLKELERPIDFILLKHYSERSYYETYIDRGTQKLENAKVSKIFIPRI